MTKSALNWLIAVNLAVGLTAPASAQDVDEGKFLYQSSCASCHGIDGNGNGPLLAVLNVAPPDLAVLAKKNGGVFPVSAVYEVIDGRKTIAAHGTRNMPVWGFLYTPSQLLNLEQSKNFMDPTFNPESVARARILAIIGYLNRIQVK